MSASFIFRNRILLSDCFSEGLNLFPQFAPPLLCGFADGRWISAKQIEVSPRPEFFRIVERIVRLVEFQEQLQQGEIYLVYILYYTCLQMIIVTCSLVVIY